MDRVIKGVREFLDYDREVGSEYSVVTHIEVYVGLGFELELEFCNEGCRVVALGVLHH